MIVVVVVRWTSEEGIGWFAWRGFRGIGAVAGARERNGVG